ncbi:MAG TPA: methyl-accepting chemotaxis protein [Ktedonobacteraceae bacterium]|nr:methyl-accepting chemotaxis protein [Ktedonobacteraceae bacterium]
MGQHIGFPSGGKSSLTSQPYHTNEAGGSGVSSPPVAGEASLVYHGEALARFPLLERLGGWFVLAFSLAFASFLVLMQLAGQIAGQSFLLKSISDCLQFLGECLGLWFSVAVALRLGRESRRLVQRLAQLTGQPGKAHTQMIEARTECRDARRSYWAWALLSTAIALYACGQALWTSYDVRMPSASVPFPGLYDIGFVSSYPFFVTGALLLTRRRRRGAVVGRVRVLLDALLVIGAAFALSWFFILKPSVEGLPRQPSFGAAFLAIYFPGGDLLLVALGAFLMFSQFATREQQPVFARLCLGLFFLAVTDSVLVWLSLSNGFNTGTLQDILWPLSMQMVGLAALTYPQSVAREQERIARMERGAPGQEGSLLSSRLSALSLYLQAATPFVLALAASAVLLTIIPETDASQRFLASLIALSLFILVAVRQTLTLNENNQLRLQLAGELVLSRRALRVTRQEADDALRDAQEKQQLEKGVQALQAVHSRIAHGDFSVRASTDPGPLQAVAVSFNLMIERLKDLEMRSSRYGQLVEEMGELQQGLERLGHGLAAWPAGTAAQSRTELRALYLGIEQIQRFQRSQWRGLLQALEKTAEFSERSPSAGPQEKRTGRDFVEKSGRADYTLQQVEQQLQRLIEQIGSVIARLEGASASQGDGFAPPQPSPSPQPGYQAYTHHRGPERERRPS